MTEITRYAQGIFCWADAGTTDLGAAKQFYGEVLGWTFMDTPMGEGMVYSTAQVGGKRACAIYPQPPQMREMGIPPHWMLYVAVDDVDATAAKVEGLGGKLMMQPFDVMSQGRMAVIQDPTGAAVGLWQAKNHIGATIKGAPGAMCWSELMTTDTGKAAAFYAGLLGWNAKDSGMPGMDYTLFQAGEEQVGGMMKITPQMGPMPPCWVVYFMVDDCKAAAERATRREGKVLMPPTDIPTVGCISTLQDPQGAVFAILSAPKD